MRILVIGYTGSGKSTAAEQLDPNSANTSDILCELLADKLQIDKQLIKENKSKYRIELWELGRSLQHNDPLALVKLCLEKSNVVTGVRNKDEINAIKNTDHADGGPLFNLIIWISRYGCEAGLTDYLTPEDADVIVLNNSTIQELKLSLLRLISNVDDSLDC